MKSNTILTLLIFTALINVVNGQSSYLNNIYLEGGGGIATMKEGFAISKPGISLSMKLGYKKLFTKRFYLDLGAEYSYTELKNEFNFVSPHGTVLRSNRMKYVQLLLTGGYQIKRFSAGVGGGIYMVHNSDSKLEDLNSTILETSSRFSTTLSEIDFKTVGLALSYHLKYRIQSQLSLVYSSDFMFVEGVTPFEFNSGRYA